MNEPIKMCRQEIHARLIQVAERGRLGVMAAMLKIDEKDLREASNHGLDDWDVADLIRMRDYFNR